MKKIILAFLLITVVFIFLFLKNATFWKPVPEYSDLSANLISDEHIVGGYQISKSGNEILLLTKSSNEHNILLWDSKKGVLVKLNPTHIPLNIDTFNNKNYRGTTQAFVGVNDNIYFESGLNLIEISPSYNIKVYDYLSDNIPHTPEEIENKTKSNLFKQITKKYSEEQIIALAKYDHSLLAYLIEIDGKNYYIQHKGIPLTIEPKIIAGKQPYQINISNHLPKIKTYKISNDKFKAKIQKVCFSYLLPTDDPCRGTRTILTLGLKKYILPSFYTPYDNRFFTSNGKFIFLSQENKLFAI